MRRRILLLLVALAAGMAMPSTAQAHPLGNFTINRYSLIELSPGTVHVTFALDIAEIPTFQALGGSPDQAAADRYMREQRRRAGRRRCT